MLFEPRGDFILKSVVEGSLDLLLAVQPHADVLVALRFEEPNKVLHIACSGLSSEGLDQCPEGLRSSTSVVVVGVE